jgi:hypothetical protein
VLERELGAERAVLPGYGHSVQRHPDFNAVLADFVERATSGKSVGLTTQSDGEVT